MKTSEPSASLVARNKVSELTRLNGLLTAFWADRSLPEALSMDFSLALEEAFMNVLDHAYEDDAEHAISVGLALVAGSVVLTIEDDGTAFNPLDAPEVDITLPAEERPIGGLGIHLIRSLMDEVSYARAGDHNRLTMKKQVPRSPR